jgi:hypothetical protein
LGNLWNDGEKTENDDVADRPVDGDNQRALVDESYVNEHEKNLGVVFC